MEIFDGKYHAKLLEDKITNYLTSVDKEVIGTLCVIQFGEDLSSQKYISLKKRFCEKIGVPFEHIKIEDQLSVLEIHDKLEEICTRKDIKSVIIQLPIPEKIDPTILDLIPIEKDIDMLSKTAQDHFYKGDHSRLPPIIRALEYFLNTYKVSTHLINAAVVGKGFLVGKPVEAYLRQQKAEVETYDENDNTSRLSFNHTLLVSATGVPNLIKGSQLSSDSIVVDFGSGILNNRVVGDIDLNSDLSHIRVLSPSPGGMGPLVVRFLVMNHLRI